MDDLAVVNVVERVAEALYALYNSDGGWPPEDDLADTYRDEAWCALSAINECGYEISKVES